MKLLSIKAQNFKGFKELELPLDGKSIVIFGINGVGKTSLLSIINYLSWNWLYRLNPTQGTAFKSLGADLVRVGSSRMEISYRMQLSDSELGLKKAYTKAKPGKGTVVEQNKKLYDAFIDEFTTQYAADDANIPILVNYGTNRSVLDIPMRTRKKHEFSKWTALELALENKLDFRTFFEWFRNQEEYESELVREKKDLEYTDKALQCVRRAIEAMIPEFHNLKIKRNPLRMTVQKGKTEFCIDQLSDGEKCTLAFFGDLARRLALANPMRDNPLEGEGIVLVDEIELHMHPSWQRHILGALKDVFPNIQFIITTHSPQVLGEVNDSYQIFRLENNGQNENSIMELSRLDGCDSNFILEEYMNTPSINSDFQELIRRAGELISENRFAEAESLLDDIRHIAGLNQTSIINLEGQLKRGRIIYEKNNKG